MLWGQKWPLVTLPWSHAYIFLLVDIIHYSLDIFGHYIILGHSVWWSCLDSKIINQWLNCLSLDVGIPIHLDINSHLWLISIAMSIGPLHRKGFNWIGQLVNSWIYALFNTWVSPSIAIQTLWTTNTLMNDNIKGLLTNK